MPSRNNNGNKSLRRAAVRVRRLLRSSRGKDILIFLLFLGVSYVFWIIMTLNDDMQRDTRVRLEITDVPEGYSFVSEPPPFLQVGIRDKGTVLANYTIGGGRTLKINYSDLTFDESKDRVTLTEQQLNSRLRSLFDPTTQIVSIRPDSLSLIVTDRAPNAARVVADVEATAASQFVISGPITVTPDTVKVYSARHLRIRPQVVKTAKITRSELKDTLCLEVRLMPEPGTRMEPFESARDRARRAADFQNPRGTGPARPRSRQRRRRALPVARARQLPPADEPLQFRKQRRDRHGRLLPASRRQDAACNRCAARLLPRSRTLDRLRRIPH